MEDLLSYDPTEKDWGNKIDIAEGPNHQIDGNSFAALRPAWHKLGTTWDVETMGKPSALGMLKLAKADFEVFATPVETRALVPYAPGSDLKVWKTAEDPKLVNLCRLHPDTHALQIIGQGSPGKKLWTPREIFVGFADALIDAAEPTVSTCGVTREGRSAFMSFKLPKGITIAGEDVSELWMTAYTSWDSSAPTTIVVGPVRTVCQNTWNYNLKNAVAKYTVKRTANAKLNIAQAKEALKMGYAYADAIEKVGNTLVEQPMSTAQFQKMMTKLWGPDEEEVKPGTLKRWEEKLDTLTNLFATAPTQEPIRGTAWAAVQAVTEFCDWETKVDAKVAKRWDEAGGADGYRVWRGIVREKSVTQPKNDILAAVLETYGFAGTEVGQLVGV